MLISIPARSTINEYKNLKTSQKEVKINETSKKLDEYVYDKTHKFGNYKAIGILSILDLLFFPYLLKPKNRSMYGDELFALMIGNIVGFGVILDNLKNKKRVLNNESKKFNLYKKNGINVVI